MEAIVLTAACRYLPSNLRWDCGRCCYYWQNILTARTTCPKSRSWPRQKLSDNVACPHSSSCPFSSSLACACACSLSAFRRVLPSGEHQWQQQRQEKRIRRSRSFAHPVFSIPPLSGPHSRLSSPHTGACTYMCTHTPMTHQQPPSPIMPLRPPPLQPVLPHGVQPSLVPTSKPQKQFHILRSQCSTISIA